MVSFTFLTEFAKHNLNKTHDFILILFIDINLALKHLNRLRTEGTNCVTN